MTIETTAIPMAHSVAREAGPVAVAMVLLVTLLWIVWQFIGRPLLAQVHEMTIECGRVVSEARQAAEASRAAAAAANEAAAKAQQCASDVERTADSLRGLALRPRRHEG